jgi:hypothetical protein
VPMPAVPPGACSGALRSQPRTWGQKTVFAPWCLLHKMARGLRQKRPGTAVKRDALANFSSERG